MKNNFRKKALVVVLTAVGMVALFLAIVFIPIGDNNDKTVVSDETEVVAETENVEASGLSKKELEKRVKELEEENAELKDEVEKYKILAEQTTQAISAPVVKVPSSDKDEDDKTSDDKEYKDSSEYYDKNYKDYTTDDDEDKKPSTPSTDDSSSDLSDTGL